MKLKCKECGAFFIRELKAKIGEKEVVSCLECNASILVTHTDDSKKDVSKE